MADKVILDVDSQLAKLHSITQRMGLLMEALDASQEFIMANATEISEPNNGSHSLMKFRRNTWMPMAEARFTGSVAEDGSYQAKAYAASLNFAKQRRGAVDVGASIGLWARRIAQDFETVTCFEPQAAARACLVRNAPYNNVVLFPYALGDEPGETTLTVNQVSTGGASMLLTDEGLRFVNETYPTKTETIRVVTLDSLELQDVDYLKIDVQGFEPKVIKGAEETLKRNSPVVVCEAGGMVELWTGVDPEEAPRLLESYGYRIAQRVGKDAIFIKD